MSQDTPLTTLDGNLLHASETARPDSSQVYNLTVLIGTGNQKPVKARAANLDLPPIEATTVRDALSQISKAARELIRQCTENNTEVPWVHPPYDAKQAESRFMVPLHL